MALTVVRDGSQVIPSDTLTTIQFNQIAQVMGPGSFDVTTARFTAGFSGIYNLSVSVLWNGGTPDNWTFVLRVFGATAAPAAVAADGITADTAQFVMEKGSALAVVAFQDSGNPGEVLEGTMMSITGTTHVD